jgi:hypothetical protein
MFLLIIITLLINTPLFSQNKTSIILFAGLNYSFNNSFKVIQTSGGFNYTNGYPPQDDLSYFPYCLELKLDRKINDKIKIGSGIGISDNYYKITFQSYKDPSAGLFANEFRYNLRTFYLPLTCSYLLFKSNIIDVDINVGATLGINKISLFGSSGRLVTVYPDTTSFSLNYLQEIDTKNKISFGSVIGFELKSNKFLKRLVLRPEVQFQYFNNLETNQELYLTNIDNSSTESHNSKVGIIPSFFSLKIGYSLKSNTK